MRSSALGLLSLLSLFATPTAHAADVLFVSDTITDSNIAEALMADGHAVTVITNDYISFDMSNPALIADLSSYDCVVWSATGDGFGGFHSAETFVNLLGYVESGGRVLVTGVGSVGLVDSNLVNFLGGTGGTSFSGNPGSIAPVESSLTVGIVDIRGITPTAYEFRYEGLTGVSAETTTIVMGFGSFGLPGAQWTIRAVGSGEIAYIANGSGAFSHPSWTASGPGANGVYNAALRNFVNAADGSASVPGAPRVRIRGPFTAGEGAAVTFELEVSDDEGDTFEVSWDLDGDGTFGEAVGALSYTSPAGTTDGDGSFAIGVEAIDAGGNRTERIRRVRVTNVAPTITSTPPARASIMQNLQYVIRADDPAGALDTLSYELVRGPTSASVNAAGIFRFVPTEGDVTPEGTAIDCEVAVSDEDGGRSTQVWRMEVANNYAPTDLELEYPTDDVVLLDRTPRFAVRDGSDLDGDPLQYFFEVDTVDTFDSPRLIQSGARDEEPGFTTFELTEPLVDGHYFWRAWLTDGDAETVPKVGRFWVVTAVGEAPDAGSTVDASDGGSTILPGDRGCSCSLLGPRSSSWRAGYLSLLLVCLLVVRRRSR